MRTAGGGREGDGGEVEYERRVASGGGRHVMTQAGGMLVDGVNGYTGAQYQRRISGAEPVV